MKLHRIFPLLLILFVLSGCTKEIGYNTNQTTTTAYEITFKNQNGQAITYFICRTFTSTKTPDVPSKLNEAAFQNIFNIQNSMMIHSFKVYDHPAAIYQCGIHHYACCTISPESSVVLHYDPTEMDDETAVQVIQSIFDHQLPKT